MKKYIYRATGGFTCHNIHLCDRMLIINDLQRKMQDFPLFSLDFSCHWVTFPTAHHKKSCFLNF